MTWNGEKLRIAREARGLNQSKLAELLGVEPPTISRWESGTNSPRPKQIPQIANILGKPVEFFQVSVELRDKVNTIEERLLALERLEENHKRLAEETRLLTEKLRLEVQHDPQESELVELFRRASPTARTEILKVARRLVDGADNSKFPRSGLKKS